MLRCVVGVWPGCFFTKEDCYVETKYMVFPVCVHVALILGIAVFGAWDPIADPALIGWWACDEGEGAVVGDSSANGNDGAFVNGDAAWMPGVYGSAVTLLGPTLVEVPAMGLTLSEATMAGWFMPYGTQPDWAAIIMHRTGASPTVLAHGFNLLATGQLAYHWNDLSATWSFRPEAYYSATEWTFCTVTIAPTRRRSTSTARRRPRTSSLTSPPRGMARFIWAETAPKPGCPAG